MRYGAAELPIMCVRGNPVNTDVTNSIEMVERLIEEQRQKVKHLQKQWWNNEQ